MELEINQGPTHKPNNDEREVYLNKNDVQHGGPIIGPNKTNNRRIESKGKNSKPVANQKEGPRKAITLEIKDRDRKIITVNNDKKIGDSAENLANQKANRDEMRLKEQEILRMTSRKQQEMWNDYKLGKNCDDFRGC
ncbi:hypothetical protein RIF29_16280 [Crotalaria pallida]|uniref:Uncharacterized protein n=1 Tax=Crotalaria pallida TaxID=3830 RepID=A0AAN9IJP8_CROPI